MKKLFIYSTYTGNGDLLANLFKENGYEIRKAVEKKKMPRSFFFGMLAGGFRAGCNVKGELVDYNKDVSEFDEIVIGSPIWNGRLTPTTNGVLAETDLTGKKISFVIYSGSGEGKAALKKIRKLYGDVKVIFLKEPKKYPDELTKLKELF